MARIAVVVTVLLVLSGCGRAQSPSPPSTGAGHYGAMYSGLCLARARAGQPEGARQAFFDFAHQALHELAAETATVDRAAAGRLLEAKQAVEADLAGNASRLAAEVDRLLDAARAALDATGQPPPETCQEVP